MNTETNVRDFKQQGDSCFLDFGHGMATNTKATILKTHLTKEKVQYDVEAIIDATDNPHGGWNRVRFYNVDEKFVKDPTSDPIVNNQ